MCLFIAQTCSSPYWRIVSNCTAIVRSIEGIYTERLFSHGVVSTFAEYMCQQWKMMVVSTVTDDVTVTLSTVKDDLFLNFVNSDK